MDIYTGNFCTGERIGYKKVKVVTLELGTSNLTFLSGLVVKTLVLKDMYALGHNMFPLTTTDHKNFNWYSLSR